jgi:hypothetical protein
MRELDCELREPLGATIRRPIFDDQVCPFDVPALSQPRAQGIEIGGVLCGGYRLENADAIDLPGLLRARSERRNKQATRNAADERSAIDH